jgi:hypothetical protein
MCVRTAQPTEAGHGGVASPEESLEEAVAAEGALNADEYVASFARNAASVSALSMVSRPRLLVHLVRGCLVFIRLSASLCRRLRSTSRLPEKPSGSARLHSERRQQLRQRR